MLLPTLLALLVPAEDWILPTFGSAGACLVGDLDGRGRSELVVAAPGERRILIFSGEDGRVTSVVKAPWFSGEIALVSDRTGDGMPDLAISGWGGVVGIVSGAAPTFGAVSRHRFQLEDLVAKELELLPLLADAPARPRPRDPEWSVWFVERFGVALPPRDHPQGPRLALGDVDGDGEPEIVVATAAEVVVLEPAASAPGRRIGMTRTAGSAGLAVTCPGDLNDDGADDVVIASTNRSYSGGGSGGGPGFVLAMSGRSGEVLWEAVGTERTLHLGHGLASPGDLDGDGVPDVVTAVHAVFDSALVALSGKDGARLWVAPTEGYPETGRRVSSGGDWNGDGIRDLVTTAFRSTCCGAPGQGVVLVSGSDGAILLRVELGDESRLDSRFWSR